MQRKLRLYHDSYVQDVKDALKADIEDFAVMNDFVTEFTTLVVVEATRRNLPVDGVIIKKRRSREKQHKLKELFSEYREEVKRQKAMEQVLPFYISKLNKDVLFGAVLFFRLRTPYEHCMIIYQM